MTAEEAEAAIQVAVRATKQPPRVAEAQDPRREVVAVMTTHENTLRPLQRRRRRRRRRPEVAVAAVAPRTSLLREKKAAQRRKKEVLRYHILLHQVLRIRFSLHTLTHQLQVAYLLHLSLHPGPVWEVAGYHRLFHHRLMQVFRRHHHLAEEEVFHRRP